MQTPPQTKFGRIFNFVYFYGGLFAVWASGAYYISMYFNNLKADTTTITNTVFGVCAILAGLSFSWAQAINSRDKDKDKALFTGECFYQASLFFLVATILKYIAIKLSLVQNPNWLKILSSVLANVFSILTMPLYTFGATKIHGALKISYNLLQTRTMRYPEVDRF